MPSDQPSIVLSKLIRADAFSNGSNNIFSNDDEAFDKALTAHILERIRLNYNVSVWRAYAGLVELESTSGRVRRRRREVVEDEMHFSLRNDRIGDVRFRCQIGKRALVLSTRFAYYSVEGENGSELVYRSDN